MAHFVSLQRNPPSPEDDINILFADAGGNAQAGLWCFMDGSTACTVKVTGPGTATPVPIRMVRVAWAASASTAQQFERMIGLSVTQQLR